MHDKPIDVDQELLLAVSKDFVEWRSQLRVLVRVDAWRGNDAGDRERFAVGSQASRCIDGSR
ncbi:MAG: hypothetical protein IMZ46_04960 [Acidobacteria bacterium]|nr:hypothetical protein [Acidobacteriota bacterium]